MKVNQGDIWLIDFEPTVGGEINKKRPAVVISKPKAINHNTLIVLPITVYSDIKANKPIFYTTIIPDEYNNLNKESMINSVQPRAMALERFHKKIGKLDKYILQIATKKLHLITSV